MQVISQFSPFSLLPSLLLTPIFSFLRYPLARGMATADVFNELEKRMAANPDIVAKIGAIFEWNVTGG
jgi:hypothetical protein